jgi:hypothetical protein
VSTTSSIAQRLNSTPWKKAKLASDRLGFNSRISALAGNPFEAAEQVRIRASAPLIAANGWESERQLRNEQTSFC